MRSEYTRAFRRCNLHGAFLAVALLLPSAASANFIGHEILYEFLLPYPFTPQESASFIVGPGPELVAGIAAGQAVLDLDESSILIGPFQGVPSDLVQLLFIDSGFRFSDLNGSLPDIASVSINPMTTVSGVSADRLEFNANSIQLDLSGVRVGFGEVIVLDTVFVPEPSSLALTACGFLALSLGVRSRLTSG